MKSIKNKLNEFANQVQEEVNHQKYNKNQSYQRNKQNNYTTSNPEQVIGTMWSYFVAFWMGIFLSLIAILVLINNDKTFFLAILIIIAMPFWAIFCFIMMIPDVKIFGFTVFSRRNLSLRKSVSLGRRVLYAFSKEFYRSNPGMATLLFIYMVLIIVAILYAVL